MGVRLSFRKGGADLKAKCMSRTKVARETAPKNKFRNAAMTLGKAFHAASLGKAACGAACLLGCR
jgi:hypothetical protein